MARFAGHLNRTSHPFDQLVADRQPQTCAAESPCRPGIALLKRFKDFFQPLRRDADSAIDHFQMQPALWRDSFILLHVHTQNHVPLRRELDRVSGQVDHNLTQAIGVDHRLSRNTGPNVQHQLDIFPHRSRRQETKRFADTAVQIGRLGIDLQPPRFDRRQIENIADNARQQFAAMADHVHILQRLGRQVHL